MQDFTGTNELGWDVQFAANSLRRAGHHPGRKHGTHVETWDDFANVCGLTRLWSGVHFEDSVTNIKEPCTTIGQAAATYVRGLIAGEQ